MNERIINLWRLRKYSAPLPQGAFAFLPRYPMGDGWRGLDGLRLRIYDVSMASPSLSHDYSCSFSRYERQKLSCNPRTHETRYVERDPGFAENYRGHNFRFRSVQELEQGLASYFYPGCVSVDTYEDTLCVSVTCSANNEQEISPELLQAFRTGKCCLWQYTLCLSPQDGSLGGFRDDEELRDIPSEIPQE